MTALAALARRRRLFDAAVRISVTGGGFMVLLVILFMFAFLVAAVTPLFIVDSLRVEEQRVPPGGEVFLLLDADAQQLLLTDGRSRRWAAESRGWVAEDAVVSPGTALSSAARSLREPSLAGWLDSQGVVHLHSDGKRHSLEKSPDPVALALESDGERRRLALLDATGTLSLHVAPVGRTLASVQLPLQDAAAATVHLADDLERVLVVARDGRYWLFASTADAALSPIGEGELLSRDATVTAAFLEARGRSLLVAASDGSLARFLLMPRTYGAGIRRANTLAPAGGEVFVSLLPGAEGRGVVSVRRDGALELWHPTTGRRQHLRQLPETAQLLSTPAGDGFWVFHGEAMERLAWRRDGNPGIASGLWREVWYEGYAAPARIWQTGAADARDEAKFNLTPLAFGTFKAALWTMLLVAPLAVAAAIHTAYFLPPGLRRVVKPAIELAEAFPTVLLGFLAGLWLAPRIEDQLAGVLVLLPALVVALTLAALASAALRRWRAQLRSGTRPLQGPCAQHPVSASRLTMPLLVVTVLASCLLGAGVIEDLLFAGDTTAWLRERHGIDYEQRNAMVLGIAMGLAVMPTVFSLAEDAIASVPAALSDGSLALGATPWQTLRFVALPSASPGVFSALMIGLGRAIGETMIVLMATGNTPILSAGLFDGLRSISATIALELPEAAVASEHYRVLFFAALLLFTFTFVVNTVAEVVRLRLRRRYLVG